MEIEVCPLALGAGETASSTLPTPSALGQAAKLFRLSPESKLLAHPLHLSLQQPPENNLEKFKIASSPTLYLCRTTTVSWFLELS